MSRNAEGYGNTGNNIKRFAKAAQLEQMQGSGSIINRKQRFNNLLPARIPLRLAYSASPSWMCALSGSKIEHSSSVDLVQ